MNCLKLAKCAKHTAGLTLKRKEAARLAKDKKTFALKKEEDLRNVTELLSRHAALTNGKLTKAAIVQFYQQKQKEIDRITSQPVTRQNQSFSNLLQLFLEFKIYELL
jgi:hypothetical protein